MASAISFRPLDQDDINELLEAIRRFIPSARFRDTTFGQELSFTITRNDDGTYTAWTYGS